MILHITNDYANSTVYKNLISNLDKNGIEQIVYTPVKSEKSVGGNLVELEKKNSKIIYSNTLNMHVDRVLFNVKINKIYKDIKSKIDFNKIKLIHAHTWFSDGAVALKLFKTHKTPYIIAVRGTDLNQFWKLPHLKKIGVEILKNASSIIFITPKYKERFLDIKRIRNLKKSLASKSIVIPNGLDSYWLNNVKLRKTNITKTIKLLYIGVFSEAKNLSRLLKAVEHLNDSGVSCTLTLVGGGGNRAKKIKPLLVDKMHITFLSKIYSKTALNKLFNQSDIFVMPSIRETFGLVYGEALSQGVPVLYSQNEGIDGVLHNEALEKAYKAIKEDSDIAIVTGKVYDFNSPSEIDLNITPRSTKRYEYANFQGGICMHRKSIYDKIGKYPQHFFYGGEEWYLTCKVLDNNWKIIKDESVILWHKRSSVARDRTKEMLNQFYNKLYVCITLYPFKYAILFMLYFPIRYIKYADDEERKNIFIKSLFNRYFLTVQKHLKIEKILSRTQLILN